MSLFWILVRISRQTSLEAYFDSFRTNVGTAFTSAGFTAPSELPLFLVMDSDNSALFASTISTTDGAYAFFSASDISSYGNANFGATGVYSYMYQFMTEVRDNEPFGTAHTLLEIRCFISTVIKNRKLSS